MKRRTEQGERVQRAARKHGEETGKQRHKRPFAVINLSPVRQGTKVLHKQSLFQLLETNKAKRRTRTCIFLRNTSKTANGTTLVPMPSLMPTCHLH
jgi:hypothetical protein